MLGVGHDYDIIVPSGRIEAGDYDYVINFKNRYTGSIVLRMTIADHDHSYSRYVSNNDATCTTDGTMTACCDHRGCQSRDTIVDKGSLLGHLIGIDEACKATQSQDGLTQGSHCQRCNKVLSAQQPIPRIGKIKLAALQYTYTGRSIKPALTVLDATGKKLIQGLDYDVNYSKGCKAVGKYKATVTFKGDYYGSKVLSFTITPKLAKVKKVTPLKKSMKVTMSAKAGKLAATGYQIQYRLKGTSKWKTVKTTASYKTIKSLKKGKTYQIRVCAYKKVGKTTILGKYTKVSTSKKIK